jgi:hypothetical protein
LSSFMQGFVEFFLTHFHLVKQKSNKKQFANC